MHYQSHFNTVVRRYGSLSSKRLAPLCTLGGYRFGHPSSPGGTSGASAAPFSTCGTLTTSQRYLSSATATSAAPDNSSNNTDNNQQQQSTNQAKDKPNIFLDNLGTIFLTAIGLVIASLVRSFYGTSRKTALTRGLEEDAALDPLEVDDLRFANPFISTAVFTQLVHAVRAAFPDNQATYKQVVHVVRRELQSRHKIPTIELGHLLDRTALHMVQKMQPQANGAPPITTETPLSVTRWLVLLSLALNAPVPDKMRVLYEILATESGDGTVTLWQVRDLVGYLQDSSQLVLETQVIPTPNAAYPIQAYHRGTPDELVRWDGGGLDDKLDVDALADILRSKSVCYQGECYASRKFV